MSNLCKSMMPPLAPSIIRMVIDYKPDTGAMIWLPRPRTRFTSDRSWKYFNGRVANTPAFDALDMYGYRRGQVLLRDLKGHRVAWAHYYGEWPDGPLDHVNGDRSDNRIANLRSVTSLENSQNCKLYKSNKSGRTGVRQSGRRWVAIITVNRRIINLGSFVNFDDAVAARICAEREHGFHPNHGKRA